MKYQNIISPNIISYANYIVINEYDTKAEAEAHLDKDLDAFTKKYRNTTWYKLNYPFAFATIGDPYA